MDSKTEKEVYYKEAAARYKEKISLPLMLVGGIRSLEVSGKLVNDGLADYVSLYRPLIREPNLIKRWKDGDTAPAACIYCNGCFGPGLKETGCSVLPERAMQLHDSYMIVRRRSRQELTSNHRAIYDAFMSALQKQFTDQNARTGDDVWPVLGIRPTGCGAGCKAKRLRFRD